MIRLRPYYANTDKAYVLATWSRSASSSTRDSHSEWMRKHGRVMKDLEQAAHVKCIVAEDAGVMRRDEGSEGPLIVGWLAYSGKAFVHYVYVRKEYRARQVASQLALAAGLELGKVIGHTFDGPSGKWLRAKYKLKRIEA